MSGREMQREDKPLVAIEIGYGEEFRVQCGDVYNKDLFFHSSYQKAAKIVEEIHRANQKVDHGCGYSIRDGMYANNILMFCANRGGGKTSALLTFGKALRAADKGNDIEKNFWGEELCHCHFALLDVIDPTLMGPQDSFMRLLLSKMYVQFRNKQREKQNESRLGCDKTWNGKNREQKILELFRKCHRYLDVLTGRSKEDTEYYDDLQLISEIGDSSTLRTEFQKLVECYLAEMTGIHEKKEQVYLVVQIDDADLNTDCAYNMIEDIRKYCMLPNILVLMAVHMEQMQQIVEQHFVGSFDLLLKQARSAESKDDVMSMRDCREMAVRYMDKVMPAGHQIHLPQVDWFIRNESARLTVRHVEKIERQEGGNYGSGRKDWLEFPLRKGEQRIVEGYQERLLRLIYNKTGIALIKPMTYLHNFVPRNMRELTHFLGFFSRLEDVDHSLSPAALCRILHREDKQAEERDESIQADKVQNREEAKGFSRTNVEGKRTDNTEISNNQKTEVEQPLVEQARAELKKREHNLQELEQYFFDGWCKLRLGHKYNVLMEELRDAVSTMKNAVVQEWCGRLWEKMDESNRKPGLTKRSYARVQEQLERVFELVLQERDPDEKFQLLYGIRLYYTIFLYREILASIARDGNMSMVKRVVNYEAWSPLYANLTEDSQFGRFQVHVPALVRLLNGEGVSVGESYNVRDSIARLCIVQTGEYEVYPVDFKNWTMTKRPNCTVVYDLGIFLLDYIGQTAQFKDSEIPVVDCLLQLLFNWDVQHQAKKIKFLSAQLDGTTTQKPKVRYSVPGLKEWSINLLLAMDRCIQEATEDYLPCQWYLGEVEPKNLANDLLFTNYEVACNYVGKILDGMKQQLNSGELYDPNAEMNLTTDSEEIRKQLESAISARSSLNEWNILLQSVVPYSLSIHRLCDAWSNKVMKSVNQLSELLPSIGDENYRERITQEIQTFDEEWTAWMKEWNDFCADAKWQEELKAFITQG